MNIHRNGLFIASMSVALLFVAPYAQAEMVKFSTELTAAAVVPPTDSKAKGNAEVTVDTDAKKVSWTVKVDGLTGEPTAAHIHGPASEKEQAPPVIDMSANIMQGSADITPEQWAALKDGKYYINIHTAKFPDGEVRGQLKAAK